MAANPGYDLSTDTIFVQGLPEDTTEDQLEEFFGQIGIIKLDKKNDCKKIWIYKDKTTGKGKGEATITYDDAPAATSAINWFNGKEFRGSTLKVELAQRKTNPLYQRGPGAGSGFRGGQRGGGGAGGQFRGAERSDRGGRPNSGSGRPGDWMCPSCSNNNFAYRNECNRCRTPKPGGSGGENRSSHRSDDRDGYRGSDRGGERGSDRGGGRRSYYDRSSASGASRYIGDSRPNYEHRSRAKRH